MKILIFDTETTGLPPKNKHWSEAPEEYPRVVQIAWSVYQDNPKQKLIENSYLIRPSGYTISSDAVKIHGISADFALENGFDAKTVFRHLIVDAELSERVVCHNTAFDISVIKAHLVQLGVDPQAFNNSLAKEKRYCTMREGTKYIELTGGGKIKWLKLERLYQHLIKDIMPVGAHDALVDVTATTECYFKLQDLINN